MKITNINSKFSKSKYIDQQFAEIEKHCKEIHIPIIDRDAADLLKLQLKLKKPHKILEIGTAHGFSTLLLAKYSPEMSEITAVELDPERAQKAKKNFSKFNYQEKIDLKVGDAFDVLLYLKKDYDFIFLDAAKGQYFYLFEYLMELLAPGGLLISDNVLYKGKILAEAEPEHKIRTIVTNLKKYLKLIMNHPELDSTIVTAGDGMAISRRKDINE
ncbi:putative O-methyltransferase YrrM [Halanaerobium saccharolyticum]|uniref:tRNA 5-hydroxyuridine methyltransferase n=1 Tax=Halanaerobium saccharolyticum TaxID=43595 RepID=A0A4V6Q832_9FIRM|nr:O-methyltransferase [Halanaerobium saccharolyticum]RAK06698.1 putative O-methyltransferase YrrM [Halanaerobium saccharolyticum]TDW01335.1 putative O-methyltransferase YrrM [Halanaerobium saccharolyticum]TDX52803.1 putative O-methyltransferase YrrM [Halanaerobium saccharolyticum]